MSQFNPYFESCKYTLKRAQKKRSYFKNIVEPSKTICLDGNFGSCLKAQTFLIKENRLMTNNQKRAYFRNYKVEKYLFKKLSAEEYLRYYEKTQLCLGQLYFKHHQNLNSMFTLLNIDLELSNKLIEVFKEYHKSTINMKVSSFELASVNKESVIFLNRVAKLVKLKKEGCIYSLDFKDLEPTLVEKVKLQITKILTELVSLAPDQTKLILKLN